MRPRSRQFAFSGLSAHLQDIDTSLLPHPLLPSPSRCYPYQHLYRLLTCWTVSWALKRACWKRKADTCSLRHHVSTCGSKGPNGEFIERTNDYVIASHSHQGHVKNMEVVEDFESRPHKAVTFLVARDKKFQVRREQNMPKAQAGFSGGQLPAKSKVDEGREEEEEKQSLVESQKRETQPRVGLLRKQRL